MKYKLIKKKIMSAMLAGTMLFSFASCKSPVRVNVIINDPSKIISSEDKKGNVLSIVILYDSNTNTIVEKELYGYLDEETKIFYDVINEKEYNFNDKDFNKYGVCSFTVKDFLNTLNQISSSKEETEKSLLQYDINKGIYKEDLMKIEENYYAVSIKDDIYLIDDVYGVKLTYSDDEEPVISKFKKK